MARALRIFVSSPGDVIPERRRAQLVIEKLAKIYARFFAIEPILWEVEPMLASGHFQDQITPPSETDIVVLIGDAADRGDARARPDDRLPLLRPGHPAHLDSFRTGLAETGYVEGHNVTIELREARSDIARIPTLVRELIRRQVDVIHRAGQILNGAKPADLPVYRIGGPLRAAPASKTRDADARFRCEVLPFENVERHQAHIGDLFLAQYSFLARLLRGHVCCARRRGCRTDQQQRRGRHAQAGYNLLPMLAHVNLPFCLGRAYSRRPCSLVVREPAWVCDGAHRLVDCARTASYRWCGTTSPVCRSATITTAPRLRCSRRRAASIAASCTSQNVRGTPPGPARGSRNGTSLGGVISS